MGAIIESTVAWRTRECGKPLRRARRQRDTVWHRGLFDGGATVVIHAAGWLEGGLTASYEKLITDVEVFQMVAELCCAGDPGVDLGLDAIANVQPDGHFFGSLHTMERYQTEFYSPLLSDYSNFGRWEERGSVDATQRAKTIWQQIFAGPSDVQINPRRLGGLEDYIARNIEAGGVAPIS